MRIVAPKGQGSTSPLGAEVGLFVSVPFSPIAPFAQKCRHVTFHGRTPEALTPFPYAMYLLQK